MLQFAKQCFIQEYNSLSHTQPKKNCQKHQKSTLILFQNLGNTVVPHKIPKKFPTTNLYRVFQKGKFLSGEAN